MEHAEVLIIIKKYIYKYINMHYVKQASYTNKVPYILTYCTQNAYLVPRSRFIPNPSSRLNSSDVSSICGNCRCFSLNVSFVGLQCASLHCCLSIGLQLGFE